MQKETIEAIQERIEAEREYHDDLEAYDNIIGMKWEVPTEWSRKEWIRKQVSTDGHDAVKTATNIYDTHNPKWQILPKGSEGRDYAEMFETTLEWWMGRANKMGGHEPFRKSLHNSVLQNRVIFQLDYLPYWLPKDKKKWTKEQKAAMKQSSFCVTVHDAKNVYYEFGQYGLKWAAAVTVMYAKDIINHWSAYESNTKEGKQIKNAIAKVKEKYKDSDDLKYIHVDFTSHDKREVSIFETQTDTIEDFEDFEEDTKRIDILDADNNLSFINWVVVEGESTPLLYSIHKAGIWENQNLYNTLIDSTTMRRAVFPIMKHTSQTGKQLDVDYTGDQDVVELGVGEDAQTLMPPSIDPAMAQLSGANTAKIAQATGIKGLASIEIAGNVQYAAVQAVIQLHMTSLTPYVRTCEKALAQLADLSFMWIVESGATETVYRTKSKGVGKEMGTGFNISAEDFDPEEMHIDCKLIANTPTDKQQKVNMLASLKQAGAHIAWREGLEELGYGNAEILEQDWLEEETMTLAMQNKAKDMDAERQMAMQAQQMQMQMEQQQQMQQAQMQQQQQMQQASQQNPMMPGGQQFNPAMGGQPTAEAMPGATSPVQQ